MKKKLGIKLMSFLVLVAIVVVWKVMVTLLKTPTHILPPPEDILFKFIELIRNSVLQKNFLATFEEIVIGFSAGAGLGIVIGYILAKVELLERALSPYILIFQTAPKISLAPLFVLWFGLGILSKVVLIALVTLFPVMINMILGVRSTEKNYYHLMRVLGARPWQVMLKLELMNSLPYLMTGLRVGLVLSITAAVIGEMMGSRAGLGFLLILGNEMYDITLLMTVILVISLLSFLLDVGMKKLQDRLLSWHESSAK
ncbi:MAG TPA: ABC transporter permease [Mesotoga sp.]|jgi:NitT/TauT family transport system permease protein|nr:ABC transporter permease [Mesotoga sp.]NLX33441.1 ABC transporter permease [Thermotogaceae bacterium]MDD4040876.1 ABC transporter permease [Mesotoga sp.]MDD4478297.1 ABC transporter permease [Mesotoga sp.]MDD5744009.1 ABC transporter permease [Mesotoga sp.]